MSSSHFQECRSEFKDENLQTYWNIQYEKIEDFQTVQKIVQAASVLQNSRQVHVFCQRAVKDLTDSIISTNGRMNRETVDAINFATRSGLGKQLRMTIAHYVLNYVQAQTSPESYSKYLKKLFQ